MKAPKRCLALRSLSLHGVAHILQEKPPPGLEPIWIQLGSRLAGIGIGTGLADNWHSANLAPNWLRIDLVPGGVTCQPQSKLDPNWIHLGAHWHARNQPAECYHTANTCLIRLYSLRSLILFMAKEIFLTIYKIFSKYIYNM